MRKHFIITSVLCLLFFLLGGVYSAPPVHDDLINLHTELELCRQKHNECESLVFAPKVSKKVTVTCYQSKKEQTDSTPDIGAFNTKVGHGSIALSQDLFKAGIHPFSKVRLEGLGIFTVDDVMPSQWKNRVDIWVPNDAKLFKYNEVTLIAVKKVKIDG